MELQEVIASDDEEIIDQVETILTVQKVKNIIATKLDEREQMVMKLRYGIDCDKSYTQKEIADKLGISRSYISRIENKALSVVREEYEKDHLDMPEI